MGAHRPHGSRDRHAAFGISFQESMEPLLAELSPVAAIEASAAVAEAAAAAFPPCAPVIYTLDKNITTPVQINKSKR